MKKFYRAFNALALIVMIFGLLIVVPLAVSWHLGEDATAAFGWAMGITLSAGVPLWWVTRPPGEQRNLRPSDGFLMVATTWVVLPIFGAIPLKLYLPELTISMAYFEAVSGLTATGASVLYNVEDLPVGAGLGVEIDEDKLAHYRRKN